MKIKQIESSEIDLIETLWNELKQHHQERTIDYTHHYVENNFSKRKTALLAKDSLAVFVGECGENIVGFCVVSIVGKQGEVDSLYVQKEQRQSNIGKSLMNAGIAWLNKHDLESIRLSVGQGNEQALSFYEKLGFKVRSTVMELTHKTT